MIENCKECSQSRALLMRNIHQTSYRWKNCSECRGSREFWVIQGLIINPDQWILFEKCHKCSKSRALLMRSIHEITRFVMNVDQLEHSDHVLIKIFCLIKDFYPPRVCHDDVDMIAKTLHKKINHDHDHVHIKTP